MKLDSQRSVMQLIPTSLFTSVINKGKGIVVSDDKEERMGHSSIPNPQPKLMAAAISSGQTMFNTTTNVFCKLLLPSLQQSQVNQTSSLITFTAEPASSKEKERITSLQDELEHEESAMNPSYTKISKLKGSLILV
ncbi:hypothetical protein F2Q70_00034958 [Brassica cretica]|uniref:Uncharacterized protein n=1 Tax=Brassica cretica TaxID=69181 RepID=A0A8S9JQE7_BRACR|nr:hypothetical protein F2Q70_00034958 [Brassica cretica]